MKDSSFNETFRKADSSINEMFREEKQVEKPLLKKLKEKKVANERYKEYYNKVEQRHKVAGIIHKEHHSAKVPSGMVPPAVWFLSPILPLQIEGCLEDQLSRIQGRY